MFAAALMAEKGVVVVAAAVVVVAADEVEGAEVEDDAFDVDAVAGVEFATGFRFWIRR